MTKPKPLKQPRVSRSCDWCRIKKTKCDGRTPCQECVRQDVFCRYGGKHNSHQRQTVNLVQVRRLEEHIKAKVREIKQLYSDLLAHRGLPMLPAAEKLRVRAACDPCKRRKAKCDGGAPCSTCVKRKPAGLVTSCIVTSRNARSDSPSTDCLEYLNWLACVLETTIAHLAECWQRGLPVDNSQPAEVHHIVIAAGVNTGGYLLPSPPPSPTSTVSNSSGSPQPAACPPPVAVAPHMAPQPQAAPFVDPQSIPPPGYVAASLYPQGPAPTSPDREISPALHEKLFRGINDFLNTLKESQSQPLVVGPEISLEFIDPNLLNL